MKSIRGYHGTDKSNINSIKTNNFRESIGKGHWLGNGIYFFLEAFETNPIEYARKWAIAESYDKENRCRKYFEYCVLACDIIIENNSILDLSSPKGLAFFNKFRESIKEKISDRKWHKEITDWQLIELLKKISGIKIVLSYVYIAFTMERIHRVYSRIPNCAIMCVSNSSCIKKESINVIEEGGIEDVV